MLKTIRRYYWLSEKFVARHFRIILRTLAFAIGISLIAIFSLRFLPTSRDSVRIGLVGKYSLESLPPSITTAVSEGLVNVNQDGEIEPALAKSWEISDDSRTYTFTLDEKKRWHDNTRIIADDLTYNFKEVKTIPTGNTITFELTEPFAPFLSAVSRPVLKENKFGVREFAISNTRQIGGVLQQINLMSEKEKRIYKFYPTESSAITAFKLGEVDKLENISNVREDLRTDSQITISSNSDNTRIVALFFNNNDSVFSSKSTRQGLAYAIRDKAQGGERALSPISSDSWAYNPLVKEYDFDEERGRNLFYTDIEKSSPPSLELKTTLNFLELAERIADNWRQILGIQVSVKVVTNISSDYQILLTDFAPPQDPDQYTIWHSTQPTNFTHYSNLRVDKLLEDGRRTMDQGMREEIYDDFQRFLLEDSPAVFLYRTSGFDVSRKPIFD